MDDSSELAHVSEGMTARVTTALATLQPAQRAAVEARRGARRIVGVLFFVGSGRIRRLSGDGSSAEVREPADPPALPSRIAARAPRQLLIRQRRRLYDPRLGGV